MNMQSSKNKNIAYIYLCNFIVFQFYFKFQSNNIRFDCMIFEIYLILFINKEIVVLLNVNRVIAFFFFGF